MENKRNITLYMMGRFISFIGTGIQQVALPLYILDVTHSGTMMGIFSILCLLPNLMTAPFAGILGDRKNRRNIMMISDFVRGILICILGFLAMGSMLNISILFLIQVIISIMDSIFNASSSALLPELISKDELMKAMSIRGGFDAASMITGPALGGIIYGILGIKAVFYLNSISFIVSGICSGLLIYVSKAKNDKKLTVRSFFSENKEALLFIKSQKSLMQLFTFAMVTNLLMVPFSDIVMPYAIKKSIGFSSQQYGFLMTAFTTGMLLGNVFLGIYSSKLSFKTIMKSSLVGEAILMFALSITIFPEIVKTLGGHSWVLFAILVLNIMPTGMCNAGVNTPISTNLQKMVPNEMRSRFFSLVGMFSQGIVPIGSTICGFLLDRYPYYSISLVIMIINAIVTLIFIMRAVPEVYEPKVSFDN